MRNLLWLAVIILAGSNAEAELWRCSREGQLSPSFTDTPINSAGVDCEAVIGTTFTRMARSEASPDGQNSSEKVEQKTKRKRSVAPDLKTGDKRKITRGKKQQRSKEFN